MTAYAILCAALMLAVLALTYVAATCIAALAWKLLRHRITNSSQQAFFALGCRLFPLFAALCVTFALALPAFLDLEPHARVEGLTTRLVLLAAFGAGLLAWLATRAAIIAAATLRAVAETRRSAVVLEMSGSEIPVLVRESEATFAAAVGIVAPQVVLSRQMLNELSPEELRAAVAHEFAHMRAFDNLKQFLLKVTQPPRWLQLREADACWREATELAADAAAVRSGASALELSSALLKVARCGGTQRASLAVSSFLALPASAGSLEARVRNLEQLMETPQSSVRVPSLRWFYLSLAATAYFVALPALLPAAHEVLEVLAGGR